MTMYAETGIPKSTVIVMAGDMAVGYLLFSACEKEPRAYRKMVQNALASMASVAKCPLVRALALPETLLK